MRRQTFVFLFAVALDALVVLAQPPSDPATDAAPTRARSPSASEPELPPSLKELFDDPDLIYGRESELLKTFCDSIDRVRGPIQSLSWHYAEELYAWVLNDSQLPLQSKADLLYLLYQTHSQFAAFQQYQAMLETAVSDRDKRRIRTVFGIFDPKISNMEEDAQYFRALFLPLVLQYCDYKDPIHAMAVLFTRKYTPLMSKAGMMLALRAARYRYAFGI